MRDRARHSCACMLASVGLAGYARSRARAATPPISCRPLRRTSIFSAPSFSPDGKQHRLRRAAWQDGACSIVLDLEKRTARRSSRPTTKPSASAGADFKTDERLLCGLSGDGIHRGPDALSDLAPDRRQRRRQEQAKGAGAATATRRSSQFQDRVLDWQHRRSEACVDVQLSPRKFRAPFPDVYALDIDSGLHERWCRTARAPIQRWNTDRKGVRAITAGLDDHKKQQYVTRDSANARGATLGKLGT